jgi:hypothetical protein
MGTAPRCYRDEAGCVVCSALHIRSLEHDNIKNYFVKCAFLIDHVGSNDDNAVELGLLKRITGTVHLLGNAV